MEDDEELYFTVVFKTNGRKLDFNPLKCETPFGPVEAVMVGHALNRLDAYENADFLDADEN